MRNGQAGIEARLARLERSNRRLRLGMAAALCGLAALGLMGATAGVPKVIRAQRFAVVNPSGQEVDSFGLKPYGSRLYNNLQMGDAPNSMLSISAGGLALTSHSGGKLGLVMLDPTGLNMQGSLGIIGLSVDNSAPVSSGLLRRLSPKARATLEAASIPLAGPLLQVADNGGGNVTVSLEGPSPTISLADSAGFSMALGGTSLTTPATGETHQTSAASIVMFGSDKHHHVIWQAPNE